MPPGPRWLVPLLLVCLSTACSWPSAPDRGDRLRVRADHPHLVLSNRSDRPVYYYAFDQGTAARSFFGACDDPQRCARVPPGQRIQLPYDSITGYGQDTETALVFWWHLVARPDGGFRPDSSMRVERVRLR